MATLKIQSAEIEPFWATPEILLFLRMRFSNIFLSFMVWKYQNEIAPTFYYGISTKTNEKDLKIPNLQPPDWKHPYWMSLYIILMEHELDQIQSWKLCIKNMLISTLLVSFFSCCLGKKVCVCVLQLWPWLWRYGRG